MFFGRGSGDVAGAWGWGVVVVRVTWHGSGGVTWTTGTTGGWGVGGAWGVTGRGRGPGDVARRTVQIILKPPEHSETTRTF